MEPCFGRIHSHFWRPHHRRHANSRRSVANCVFVVVSVLVIADCTRGTGHFNLAAGALATTVGIGAALSNAIGGTVAQHYGFAASFLFLAAIALLAFGVLWFAVPETRREGGAAGESEQSIVRSRVA
jgi:predicted MFS family arabinose efflux permease